MLQSIAMFIYVLHGTEDSSNSLLSSRRNREGGREVTGDNTPPVLYRTSISRIDINTITAVQVNDFWCDIDDRVAVGYGLKRE